MSPTLANLIAILIGVFVAALLVLSLRGADEGRVQKWERTYGIELSASERALLERRLTRVGRVRAAGALAGFLVVSALGSGEPEGLVWLSPWFGAIAGYLAGAIVTEIALRPLLRPPEVTASLVPRSLSAYVPRYAWVALIAIPVAAVGLVVPYASLFPERYGRLLPSLATVVIVACAIGAVSLVTWIGVLAALRRPQPFTETRLMALDDAFRAASLHALMGAAVTLELLLLTFLFSSVQNAESLRGLGRFGFLLSLAALFSLAMAVASWVILGHPRSWRVRRAPALGDRP